MSFQGDIASISLGDVVQNLAANQKSGVLKVRAGGAEREIVFVEGKAASYADALGFSIAEWLVEKDVVSRAQLEEALHRQRRAKRKSLGDVLSDLKLLKLEEYRDYLAGVVQDAIFETLSFQEGSFEFVEGDPSADPRHREALALGLGFAAAALVMEAARRADDWQQIRVHIPSEDEVYVVPPASRARALEEAEDDVWKEGLKLLDGTRSLREVIAKLPYSRFDACRAVAGLIATKTARPVDGSVLAQLTRRRGDPRQVIACLKAILEREPNNRLVLEELVGLHLKVGQRDQSATCAKLLALSHLGDGDLKSGERWLRESLKLNPRDIATWQKLQDVVRRQGDPARLLAFGKELADHFKRLGLLEVVRDHLLEMVSLFPEDAALKLDLAETRLSLGEQKEGIEALTAIGLEHLKRQRLDEAEKVFARVLKHDRENAKGRQLLEKIRSGKIARRQALRRKLRRSSRLSWASPPTTSSCGASSSA
ncbi:MAG: DUF4388 domain-containing protein [Planctomycetes bacterium]|nr:DUF4388 domain-containing protein [Planctomycetota bacterium]